MIIQVAEVGQQQELRHVQEMAYMLELHRRSIIGSLNKGNRFEVDGKKSGEWVHIKVPGIGIGYMHQNYVSYDNGNYSNVSIAQAELNKRFNAGLAVDDIWAANSKKAYISAIQSALNSVYGAGLSVDGIWAKIQRWHVSHMY